MWIMSGTNKHKYISALCVFLCLLPFLAGSVYGETLRLLTYNVHNGVGLDRKRDHKRIADVINSQKPDFVAIQEVDSATVRSAGRFVLGEIADLTSMYPVFAPAINYDGGLYGIGLLTRAKPDRITRIGLPGREESRALLIADFGDYAVACTHLSLTPEDALASIDVILSEVAHRFPKPFILMGDFNSLPESAVIDSLKRDFQIVSDPGILTFPADSADRCLDYIMVSSPDTVEVKSNAVIGERVASDHRPVMADIVITR